MCVRVCVCVLEHAHEVGVFNPYDLLLPTWHWGAVIRKYKVHEHAHMHVYVYECIMGACIICLCKCACVFFVDMYVYVYMYMTCICDVYGSGHVYIHALFARV